MSRTRNAPRAPALRRLARWAVTLALVTIVARQVDFRALGHALATADLAWLAIALVIAAGDRLLMATKYYPLLRAQASAPSLVRTVRAYLASNFASLFLPMMSGDVLRAVALGRDRRAVVEVGVSITVERLLGLIGSAVPIAVALVLADQDHLSLTVILPWALAALSLAVLALLVPFTGRTDRLERWLARSGRDRWAGYLTRAAEAFRRYRTRRGTLVAVGLLSTIEQGFPILVFWTIARSLGSMITLPMLLVAVPLTMFLGRLPISVAGIGVGEGALVYLLGLFGVPAFEALALALVGRLLELIVLLPGAILWFDLARAAPAPRDGPVPPTPSAPVVNAHGG